MSQSKDYNRTPHKIQSEWQDILKLIALEEQLITRLDKLEQAVNHLWQVVSKMNSGQS